MPKQEHRGRYLEFAYLDRERLEDFVSSSRGGLPHEFKRSERDDSAVNEFGGSLAGASAKRRSSQTQMTSEELARATPASLFRILYDDLVENDGLQRLDGFDRKIWDQIEEREMVDLECEVEFSSLERILDVVRSLQDWAPFLTRGAPMDEQLEVFANYAELLSSQTETHNVRINPVGSRSKGCIFVSTLQKASIRGSKDVLNGRYRVLGRVSRCLQPGATLELFSMMPPGLRISKDAQRGLIEIFKSVPAMLGTRPTMADLQIPFPAKLLTAVAIYR